MSDDKRLLDDATTDDALRRALEAGRAEAPTADRLAAIAAKLPPIGPGPGGGGGGGGAGGGASGAATGAVGGGIPFAAKVALGVVALAAAAGLGAVAIGSGDGASASASASASVNVPVPVPASASVSATASASAAASVAASVSVPTIARPAPSTLVAAPDPKLDGALVDEAARLVATDPNGALAKCDEHARLFPKSSVAEERERIAIEALVHLGRRPEARTRADAFAKRFPGSAYQRRIDALFGDGG